MHKTFIPLFGVAVLGTFLAAFFDASLARYIGVAAGVLPLIRYHWTLYTTRDASPDEIDSVYYFGFLVTVVTLMFATISIGRGSAQLSLSAVLTQFGLGLIATAYGLFARLHLLSTVGPRGEGEIATSNERLARSVQEAASQFDLASHQVTAFVHQLGERLVSIEQTLATAQTKLNGTFTLAETEFRARLSASAASFAEELVLSKNTLYESTTASISTSTQAFQSAVSALLNELQRAQGEATKISFRAAAEQLNQLADHLTESIATVTSAARIANDEASASIGQLTSASRKTLLLVNKISGELEALEGMQVLVDRVKSAHESLALLSGASATATTTVGELSSVLRQFEGDVRTHLIEGSPTATLSSHLKAGSEALRVYIDSLKQIRPPQVGGPSPVSVRPEPPTESRSWWSR